MDDVLQIKDLSYEKWKMKVLSQVDDALVTACLLFIEQMRSNVELSKEEKNHVKFAIQSFTEVTIINSLITFHFMVADQMTIEKVHPTLSFPRSNFNFYCRFAIIDEEIH